MPRAYPFGPNSRKYLGSSPSRSQASSMPRGLAQRCAAAPHEPLRAEHGASRHDQHKHNQRKAPNGHDLFPFVSLRSVTRGLFRTLGERFVILLDELSVLFRHIVGAGEKDLAAFQLGL